MSEGGFLVPRSMTPERLAEMEVAEYESKLDMVNVEVMAWRFRRERKNFREPLTRPWRGKIYR